MKKTYIAPASQETEIKTMGMLCTSLQNIGTVEEPLARDESVAFCMLSFLRRY